MGILSLFVPFQDSPEHYGSKERGHSVDLTFDSREPIGIAESIGERAYDASGEDAPSAGIFQRRFRDGEQFFAQQGDGPKEVMNVDGVILTKMDGTAKGGIAVAITKELQVPVLYIGVGEGADDLQKFNSRTYAEGLFNE